MILGFKQKFPWGEPTHFREKILLGIDSPEVKSFSFSNGGGIQIIPYLGYGPREFKVWEHLENGFVKIKDLVLCPKIHTMREDKHGRWRANMSMQMVYRGPNYSIADHFNKGIPELEKCTGIQKIKIDWFTFHYKDLPQFFGRTESITPKPLDFITERMPVVYIDGIKYDGYCSQVKTLAQNDGFDSIQDFYRWFNRDWEGKILHWTDFRY